MIFDITYPDPNTKRQIGKLVGPAYSFLERIKMGGIGTTKLQILEASDAIYSLLGHTNDTHYCYLECRINGLIVGFKSVMKTYIWAIPFHKLSMYNNAGKLVIYGNQDSIKLIAPFNGSIDKKFIRKILALKSDYISRISPNG